MLRDIERSIRKHGLDIANATFKRIRAPVIGVEALVHRVEAIRNTLIEAD